MADTVWVNIRYAMIAIGVGLLTNYTKDLISSEQAVGLITPVVDAAIGGAIAASGWVWGILVRRGTKAVPVETAARSDVTTVSAATGKVEPATTGAEATSDSDGGGDGGD